MIADSSFLQESSELLFNLPLSQDIEQEATDPGFFALSLSLLCVGIPSHV